MELSAAPASQPDMGREFAGRVAVVTGGSRRMGLAISEELARGGADIVMAYGSDHAHAARAVAAIKALGRQAIAVQADVADPEAVRQLVAAARSRFGRVDILVNNAAKRPHGRLSEISLDAFHAVTRLVLDGCFLCARECEALLAASGQGAIINIGGLMAQLGQAETLHVSAAKHGLIGMTRSLAQHFGPLGVTVNCVTPGSIGAAGDSAERRARQHPAEQTPMRRVGTVEDIAGVVRALAGPSFRFVTGQNIQVNGGIHMV